MIDWYVMRGSGLVALALLSAAVFLGVVGARRWRSPRWPRSVTAGLHRSVALLAVCFVAVHVVTAVLDSWVGLGWLDVVVPFRSPYRPLWVGLGAVAVDLAVAVTATSVLRRHLRYGTWRAVHWASWLLWPLAVLHGLGAGSDSRAGWGLVVVLGCVAPVAAAAAWRLAAGNRPVPLPRRPRSVP
ncbi:MAG TPA: ferric reductase-like transmembrane domain-containing protein [Acidimicrobiales bacterium]|nr:ferric reductase-like transmembrane domain-containing protein [Acidimicrobiales bacterium]